MPTNLTGLRKTAILLLSLGEERASRILSRLPAEAIPQVRREMAHVGAIPASSRREVFDEFCDSDRDDGGAMRAPFARLLSVAPCDLRRSIEREHPQTIAVILAYLPRELAGEVLADTPPRQQVEILQRIASMEMPEERVVREIERALEERLTPALPAPDEKQNAIAEVLNAAAHRSRREVVPFERVLQVDPRDVRAALRRVDHETIAMALITASAQAVRMILENLSPRDAEAIKSEIQNLGPVRICDAEAAQQQIIELAMQGAGE